MQKRELYKLNKLKHAGTEKHQRPKAGVCSSSCLLFYQLGWNFWRRIITEEKSLPTRGLSSNRRKITLFRTVIYDLKRRRMRSSKFCVIHVVFMSFDFILKRCYTWTMLCYMRRGRARAIQEQKLRDELARVERQEYFEQQMRIQAFKNKYVAFHKIFLSHSMDSMHMLWFNTY